MLMEFSAYRSNIKSISSIVFKFMVLTTELKMAIVVRQIQDKTVDILKYKI